MLYRMVCENSDCSYDQRPYTLEIRAEAYMDERNVAAMFCPHCKGRLTRRVQTEGPAAGGEKPVASCC